MVDNLANELRAHVTSIEECNYDVSAGFCFDLRTPHASNSGLSKIVVDKSTKTGNIVFTVLGLVERSSNEHQSRC